MVQRLQIVQVHQTARALQTVKFIQVFQLFHVVQEIKILQTTQASIINLVKLSIVTSTSKPEEYVNECSANHKC